MVGQKAGSFWERYGEHLPQLGEHMKVAEPYLDKVEAMDNDLMKEQHPSMPIDIDRQSRVTFGGSKKS